MGWTIMFFVLLATFLTVKAESAVNASQENRSGSADQSSIFNRASQFNVESLLQLRDHIKQGDTLLNERLEDSYKNLKTLLTDRQAQLQKQLVVGIAQLTEQLKELRDDEAWIKDELVKIENRVMEEITQGHAKSSQDLTDQKEAFQKLETTVKMNSADLDHLKEQMIDVEASFEYSDSTLRSTKVQLQNIVRELNATRNMLQSTQRTLQVTQDKMNNTEQKLLKTRAQLQDSEKEVHSLKVQVNSLQLRHEFDGLKSPDMTHAGSTFIRWGNQGCPANTSLVYSGVAGGSWYQHTGGASNYLCLVMDPKLDKSTLPNSYTYLYGGEYQDVEGHHQQDPVCSVCRAPQTTTLMIPATFNCPSGWTTQYKGHLMTGHHSHMRGTEYVCMDKAREHREGGQDNLNGALFYQVTAQCGSLPCPPYTENQIVTCVVCSK